jgi:hypothetical protein
MVWLWGTGKNGILRGEVPALGKTVGDLQMQRQIPVVFGNPRIESVGSSGSGRSEYAASRVLTGKLAQRPFIDNPVRTTRYICFA